jgi:hypothetical protein
MPFHRTCRPLLELAALQTYAGRLARVAEHANDGTRLFRRDRLTGSECCRSCFTSGGSTVSSCTSVTLPQRLFDPTDKGTLVCSAEFLAELGD